MRMRLLAVLALGVFTACGSSGPASMEFVEVLPPQPKIGDVVTVRFKLLDSRGVPLAGETVDFKLSSANNGVTLSPTSAQSIRGSGFAETQLVASARVNSVIVVATAGDKQVFSPPITFAGTVPNGRQLTFQCGPVAGAGSGGRHAIGAFDQTRYLIAGSALECGAHVGDRNGDGVSGALVSFLTEAGTIGPSETSTSNLVGDAVILYKTSFPLPMDVDPGTFSWSPTGVDGTDATHTGEYLAPLWMHPFNWVEDPLNPAIGPRMNEPRRPDPIRRVNNAPLTNNPRDNLVAMIAVTSGEEGFTDTNNNGQFDQGVETFDDLTEPFVDANDDGTWNENERFIDVNGNRQWDGKNGKWDSNTLIWRQERLLWTGIPATEDTLAPGSPGVPAGHKPVYSKAMPDTLNLICPRPVTSSFCSAAGPPTTVVAYIADPWFNSIAKNGDSDTCKISAGDQSPIKIVEATTQTGIAYTYPAGQYYRFVITDARDPQAPPTDQVPRRDPPIPFVGFIDCTFSSSPKDPYITHINAGTITGTIE
ncbi:MAG: hypothetical protein ACOY3Y_16370 [Acidobacteriota bacterium]